MRAEDEQVRRLLHDLGRSLVQAMSSSSEVAKAVRAIQDEGYSLHLAMDDEDGDQKGRIELTTRRQAPREPAFLLDGTDVHILRSLGIDPTRPGRRRRP